jgi:hypothetical protein
MVRRALAPGAGAAVVALALGLAAGGPGVAASAGLGVALVVANFAAHGWTLARASGVSLTAVHAAALVGPVVRLGALVGALFALDALPWFSPLAFGLAAVPGSVLLLAYEAWLATRRGVGAVLQIPPDPVVVRAAAARAVDGENG